MGLLNFFKDAGEKLFSKDPSVEDIKKYIQSQGLSTEGLEIKFDGKADKVSIAGRVRDQETKEKIILCCGNVKGVTSVEDNLTVESPAVASQFYTVQSGDTLSKIAARYYGDSKMYPAIFEANRPMLSHPDRIYPGQSLRIPPLAKKREVEVENRI